jgi:hypothetical protein
MNKEYCNRIYGASDDLLEIDGALIEDEVNESMPYKIKCSDGTEAIFEYNTEGIWECKNLIEGRQFMRVVKSLGDEVEHTDLSAIGCSSYSDVLLVREPLAWIKINKKYFRP